MQSRSRKSSLGGGSEPWHSGHEDDLRHTPSIGKQNVGQRVLTDRKLLSILFDYLNPNEDSSLSMFFASKRVLANLDVTAARIKDS